MSRKRNTEPTTAKETSVSIQRLKDAMKLKPSEVLIIMLNEDDEMSIATSFSSFNDVHGTLARATFDAVAAHSKTVHANKAGKAE